MKSGVFFWGTFLIFLGLFLLLDNLGVMTIGFEEVFDWWPLILIFWGISFLKIPEIMRNIIMALSGVLLALILISFIAGYCNLFDHVSTKINIMDDAKINCTSYDDKSGPEIKNAVLIFSGGAGKFDFAGTDDYLYHLNSGSGYCQVVTENPNDSTVVINYSHGEGDNISSSSRYTKFQLFKNPVWDLEISAGASKINMDLNNLKIANLDIDAGAIDADIKLGALVPMTKVTINCGAAKLKIEVPESAGCSVQGDMALSKTQFKGLTRNSTGVYISENYYKSVNKIDFYIDGALSKIDIQRK
ncbi:MAG: DUF5668 domain-containing protein [Candidatus Kapabacteria bacterium]|nr:DUF5668 domain-containing protein [Candidatus Kapabacteria bacterium]